MKFCKKRRVLILIGIFVLSCVWSCQPRRHRIGNNSQVMADVEPLLQACLSMCEEPGDLRGRTRKACANACYDLRREFPFLDKGYSSYEQCAKDMDNLDLNRDTIIAQYQARCPEGYETSLQRQACKDAAEAFYTAARTEKVCRSGSALASPVAKPAAEPGVYAPAPARPLGPIIYDTPKYGEGKPKAAKPAPARAPAPAPVPQKAAEGQKTQPAAKDAPAQPQRKPEPLQKDAPAPPMVQEPVHKKVPEIPKPAEQPEPAAPGTLYLKPGEADKPTPEKPRTEPGKPAPNREAAPVVTPGAQPARPEPPAAPKDVTASPAADQAPASAAPQTPAPVAPAPPAAPKAPAPPASLPAPPAPGTINSSSAPQTPPVPPASDAPSTPAQPGSTGQRHALPPLPAK